MIEIARDSMANIKQYATVSCAFRVASVIDIACLQSQFHLAERAVNVPYLKDYDALTNNHPAAWHTQCDTRTWQVFAAFMHGVRVGGAIAIPKHVSSEHHASVAELWDFRVAPEWRARGIGQALFREIERWAVKRRCTALHIETQHVNVGACRFYHAQGCVVASITPHAYPSLPDEVRIVWRKNY